MEECSVSPKKTKGECDLDFGRNQIDTEHVIPRIRKLLYTGKRFSMRTKRGDQALSVKFSIRNAKSRKKGKKK